MKKITAAITGVGAYLPDYLLTNDELSRMVDTSDEWIMTRIGIKTRHIEDHAPHRHKPPPYPQGRGVGYILYGRTRHQRPAGKNRG